jgi:hypothetical protein
MMTRRMLVLAILVLPAIAEAQRGGGGGGAPPVRGVSKNPRGDNPNYNGLGTGGGAFTISNRDVESLNPIKLLLDKKKDLTLTDDQVKQLRELDAALKTENDTLFNQIDSLRKEMKAKANAPNPTVEQLRVKGARTHMVEVIKAVRERFDRSEPDALALLDETQQKAASGLLDKHQQEGDEMLQAKLGGRRRS